MKTTITTILIIVIASLYGQQIDSTLVNEIPVIKDDLFQQKQEIKDLKKQLNKQNFVLQQQKKALTNLQNNNKAQQLRIDSLNNLISLNKQNIETNSKQLGTEIKEVSSNAENKISKLDKSLDSNRLYWIIATLGLLLLGALMYLFLGKKIKTSKTDVESQIEKTKQSLEEESVKLDNKLIEILETQLKLQQEQNKNSLISSNDNEKNHKLALKVADEIIRMQKNISKIDQTTKGLKPLLKGIERIKNNFASNGYEMIDYLNNKYDERMNIDVINFITDDNLPEGSRIISAVIKPQVNYNGILIQKAQVDVSQN